jgi:subtilase family serine protease
MKPNVLMSACALALAAASGGAHALPTGRPTAVLRAAVDESRLLTLAGNTRPEVATATDLGRLADDFQLPGLQLLLKRSPEREASLKQYLDDLHNPKSPNYHQWLTPEQFATYYGVAQEDVAAVTGWLQSHGFTVTGVAPTGLHIDFTGTAAQVARAFHTEIHQLDVKGTPHIANISDPAIPAALQAAVAGVVSLHDFRPKAHNVPHSASPNYTYAGSSGTRHALVPGDIATIYNLKPLFDAGYTGLGQTIMVVEDTYLYSTTDFTTFRKTFGLSRAYPYGSLSQVSPTGSATCNNPGYAANGDDSEAAIDVEWASAAAPNATIVLAACKNTSAFGGLIALQNTLNGPAANLPSVVSISYGEAEVANGATANAAYNTAYQQAVTEGVSIFVSSGDELADSYDGGNIGTHGIGISGFASTPYNVAVGGLDFGYKVDGVDPATYWNPTNSSTFASALSYIQEVPWNASCGSPMTSSVYGSCASQATGSKWLNAYGGSGGPSGCATGTRSTSGVVSGTCAGYAKPSWQAGLVGNPGDNVRDIPDVSLFASNGIFDGYYVTCWSNPSTSTTEGGGFTCNGAPSGWAGFGGTSVSAPIMAGIQALVNQKTGSRWGNPNTVYYKMAKAAFGATGSAACNSTTVNKLLNTCVFYDVTEGDIVGACEPLVKTSGGTTTVTSYNCFGGAYNTTTKVYTIGSSSTSNSVNQPAYASTVGWDFASGIGSVNAYNLVMGWAP